MLSFIGTIIKYVQSLFHAIPECERLRSQIEQQAGHITALREIIKTKEGNAESISQNCEHLKSTLHKFEQVDKDSKARLAHLRAELHKANQTIIKAKGLIRSQKQQLTSYLSQLASLAKQDGKFWEVSPLTNIPAFRQRSPGQATIIAVMNLKGGVGKTTVTANLGATWWNQGKRVLLVDLDYQHSLTNLCMDSTGLQEVDLSGRYIDRFFYSLDRTAQTFCQLFTHIDKKKGYLIAAREQLGDVEEHVKANWLLGQSKEDARYALRSALHQPSIQANFDVIVLDCPPRLTLASINALTASDFVLVPVLPDKASTQAVPRLLRWLRKLKATNVAPDLELLGIIANGTFSDLRLSRKESNLISSLIPECEDAWSMPVDCLRNHIPRRATFGGAAESKQFAALDPSLSPVFSSIVSELERRILSYAGKIHSAASK